MEIILADHSGTCWGVKRSIKIAFEAVRGENRQTYSLGPLIHNPQVVSKLEQEGVKLVNDVSQIESGTVLIRTHGAPPAVKEALDSKAEVKIVDATCPIVSRSQRIASKLGQDGYKVVIVGDRNHPEVKGVLGFAGEGAMAVNTPEEAEELRRTAKLGILAQTTITLQHFQRIVNALVPKALEFKIFNTLCNETSKTQESTQALADEVDMMVVIGGKNSANTIHLVEICREKNLEAYHIEQASELRPEWFTGKSRVGVTAGASTPDWIIEEVLNQLKQIAHGGMTNGGHQDSVGTREPLGALRGGGYASPA